MVSSDEEHEQYLKDRRTACKYGIQCYQKNTQHLQKYKHPPKKRPNTKVIHPSNSPKRQKLDGGRQEKQTVTSNKVADEYKIDDSKKQPETKKRPLHYLSDSDTDILDEEFSNAFDAEDLSAKASTSTTTTSDQKDSIKENGDSNKSMEEETKIVKPLFNNHVSSLDPEQFILDKFLVKMPPDFYSFWDYCKSVKPDNPSEAFAHIGLHLVGPYDVCAGKFLKCGEKTAEEYLIHWRYFYDPPEFQTVIKGLDATGYHIGYFRDDPSELPAFVGSNQSQVNGEITIMGDNIFAAVSKFMESALKTCDPFKKLSLSKAVSHIKAKAVTLNLSISDTNDKIKARSKKVLTSTFNKAGLVVPYNRETQLGYRHLYISNKDLRKLLDRVRDASDQQRNKVLSELQPVLTAASIATDECDFGTGLELGWNILSHGVDSLNATIVQNLSVAYNLLNRDSFAKIASAHMANRRKGTNLSIL